MQMWRNPCSHGKGVPAVHACRCCCTAAGSLRVDQSHDLRLHGHVPAGQGHECICCSICAAAPPVCVALWGTCAAMECCWLFRVVCDQKIHAIFLSLL
jgi:hypothetical protein